MAVCVRGAVDFKQRRAAGAVDRHRYWPRHFQVLERRRHHQLTAVELRFQFQPFRRIGRIDDDLRIGVRQAGGHVGGRRQLEERPRRSGEHAGAAGERNAEKSGQREA